MKQSIYLVIIQIISIIVGVFTTFFVAAKLPANLYALLGFQAIISSILVSFSNTGLETLGLRNFLSWKESNKFKIINIITTQAIFLRLLIATLIGFILMFYAYFISKYKLDGNYLNFLFLFVLSGIFTAVNDSYMLLLKAHNKFLIAITSSYFVNIFGKFIALLVFIKYGLEQYLYFVIILPLFLTIYLHRLKIHIISWRYMLSKKILFYTLKQSKHFALSSYISFLLSQLDQLLVSLFLPIETMGVFTLIKRIQEMFRTFISNFFDPLLQKTVQFKRDLKETELYLNKILNWGKIALLLFSIGLGVYLLEGSFIIDTIGLSHYPFLFENILYMLISFIFFLLFKIQYYLIATYVKPSSFVKFTVFSSLASISAFVLFVLLLPHSLICGYFILANLLILTLTYYYVKIYGGLVNMIKISNY
ncbi:MAG: hypothetical protein Q7U54_14365 [Bacteroidales bacterium]|nr:hypothetical protein [Bacteroidales bacterium]